MAALGASSYQSVIDACRCDESGADRNIICGQTDRISIAVAIFLADLGRFFEDAEEVHAEARPVLSVLDRITPQWRGTP